MDVIPTLDLEFKDRMRWYGSAERPEKFATVFWEIYGNAGFPTCDQAFWRLIMREWNGFDAIPHAAYQRVFSTFLLGWHPDLMQVEDRAFYDTLAGGPITIYRGQSRAQPVGLSWTLDRQVAAGFAAGHRGAVVPDSIIYEARVLKRSIAFVQTERKEAEVVLFKPPRASRISASQP